MFRAVFIVGLVCGFASGQIPESTRTLFQYDRAAPLNLTQKTVEQPSKSVRIFEIEYDSPRGGRVTGYLIEPRNTGRFAGIVFGHWGEGNHTEFIAEAMRYAQAGAVSVLIDYPWVRPEPWRRKIYTAETSAEQDRDGMAQAVVDLRRAIDLLLARPDVDPKRIAYVGHSYGAQFGAILSAVDHRMATSVLMAGVPGSAALWFDSKCDPDQVDFRKTVGIEALKKELEVTGVLDAIRFVPAAAPIPLLFQFAQFDRFSIESMRTYADAATGPKQVLWYPTGHALNDPQALTDRAKWLEQKIGLRDAVRAVGTLHCQRPWARFLMKWAKSPEPSILGAMFSCRNSSCG